MRSPGWRVTSAASEDDGFTLVELIVYSVLLIIVLGILTTFVIQVFTKQSSVVQTGQANNGAQLALSSIERGIRNADAAHVETVGASALYALTYQGQPVGAVAVGEWRCQGWALVDTGDERGTGLFTATTAPGAMGSPSASDWTLLARNVNSAGSSFTVSGGTVDIVLDVSTVLPSGTTSAVTLQTQVVPRVQDSSPGTSCLPTP